MASKEGVLEIPDSEEEPLSSSPTNEPNVVIDGQNAEASISPALGSTSDISDALRRDHGSSHVDNDVISNGISFEDDQNIGPHSVSTFAGISKMNETDIAKSIPSDPDRTIAELEEMHSLESKEMPAPELTETNDQSQSEENRKDAPLHPALNDLPQQSASETPTQTSDCITEGGSDRVELLPLSDEHLIPLTNETTDSSTIDHESRHETVQSEDQVQEQTRHPILETVSRIIPSSQAASLDVTQFAEAIRTVPSKSDHAEKVHEPMVNDQISATTGEDVNEGADMQNHGVESLDHPGGGESLASHDTDEKAFGPSAVISPDIRVPELKLENATSQSMEFGTGHPIAGLNSKYHTSSEMNIGQMEAECGVRHNALKTENMNATPQSENSSKLTHDHVQPDSEVAGRTCENQDSDSSAQVVLPTSQEVSKPGIVAKLAPKQSKTPTNTQFKKVSSTSACSSSAKSSPEVTLAELKAQKAALLMSLAALPAIQVLIEEIAAAQEDPADHHDEPSETDIVVAANKIVKDHIKLLHEYNELKDIGQGLMGMIADQRGVRIVEVQDEFGIDAND